MVFGTAAGLGDWVREKGMVCSRIGRNGLFVCTGEVTDEGSSASSMLVCTGDSIEAAQIHHECLSIQVTS